MTPQKQSRSSALFLTELILAILFFAAASAVCVQIFIKSHLLSLHSRQLNLAVNESSAIAELIEASDSMEEAVSLIQGKYPLAEITENNPVASGTISDAEKSSENTESDTDAASFTDSKQQAASKETPASQVVQIFYNKDLTPCAAADNDASLMLSASLSQENRELYAKLVTQTISDSHESVSSDTLTDPSGQSDDTTSDYTSSTGSSDVPGDNITAGQPEADVLYTLHISHHLQRRASHES